MTYQELITPFEFGSSNVGRTEGASFTSGKLNLPKVGDCPHRKLSFSLSEDEKTKKIPCLNEVCFAIGEFFNLLNWANVTEKQIDGMGKIMHRLDCSCYNKMINAEDTQPNRTE